MTHVVALTGYAGVGKDEFARHLVKRHGYARLAFADKLKDLLHRINPLIEGSDDNRVYLADLVWKWGWDEAKRVVPEIRSLLQDTGMAARDVLGEDVWTKPVIRQAKQHPYVVITDLRMHNELASLRGSLFESVIVMRLTRSDIGPANSHVSEQPLPHHVEVDLDSVCFEDMPEFVDGLVLAVDQYQRCVIGQLPPQWTAEHSAAMRSIADLGRSLDATGVKRLRPLFDDAVTEARS